jgi:amidase
MTDILQFDATGQLRSLNAKDISARELLDLELARYRGQNERLNAVVAVDVERAQAEAAAIDEARSRDAPLGPLAGLPMTVKDTYDIEGLPASGGGVAAFLERDPVEDAVLVARAKSAGAVIWGKTNSPVMAGDWQTYNRLYGTTNNPWDLERTCGGSSGGSAVALAAQMTALEMGSDIAGSLRVPAAFCGVFAHKPTLNLLPKTGHVPPSPGTLAPGDLSVAGPMARSARDLILLLNIMSAGETPREIAPADPKGLRIGLWLDDPAMVLDAAVRTAIEVWAAEAEAAGFQVRTIKSPVDATTLLATYNMLLMSHLGAAFPEKARADLFRKRTAAQAKMRKGAGPLSYASTILAVTASHRDWILADETRHQMKAQMAQLFRKFDVIVTPVAPVEPFFHDHSEFSRRKLRCSNGQKIDYASMKTWVALATTLGLPATSIPAGFSASGLPVGIQVIGPEGGDARTLAVARALEETIGGYVAPDLGGL